MEQVFGKSDGTTLMDHIQDCLGVYSQLREALPLLPQITGLDNFWELLFGAVYFHDWGKCHREFQKMLKGIEPNFWNNQRHEIYSLPFVEKLDLNEKDKQLIQRVIIAHHKTFFELLEKWKSEDDLGLEFSLKWERNRKYKRTYHPEDFIENLRHNLNYGYLRFLVQSYPDLYKKYTKNIPKEINKEIKINSLEHPLKTIVEPEFRKIFSPEKSEYWQNLLLWGATKICDHYGSAKIKKISKFTEKDFSFLRLLETKLKKEGQEFYEHQKDCFEKMGNCILIAPTGSGKTESAIGWLKKQISNSQGRAFYILPYTASINAMHKRLINEFSSGNNINGNNIIGIQHGKLTQYVASLYEEIENGIKPITQRNEEIKRIRDLYKKMIYPLKIATPFQILKHCYGVKGFEMGFTELAGAKLIFDEIHAYDEITFAQILTSLDYFIKYLNCNIMVMTATLPTFMLEELKKVLKVEKPIKANRNLLEKFTRHRVEVRDGNIYEQLPEIRKFINKGKRIIIVCNTVRNAQEMYKRIIDLKDVPQNKITLLHSRFHSLDRNRKEKQALNEDNQILIGTQAIEVSLDIDYDVMFTEPAPLDALFQRFGRVNRKRRERIASIYVCTNGGENDQYIYPQDIVKRTLELLNDLDIIYENELQNYLDFVYPAWSDKQFQKYNDTRVGFAEALKSLQPYARHKENEEEFYDKFDGIKVLPVSFLKHYKTLIQDHDYIAAERNLVSIHRGMYLKLKNEGQIDTYYFEVENQRGKNIKKIITIARCHYDSEIGMTDEFEELSDDSNFL
ncbi:CRISPR-associated nuclease/helicase Cas3 [bacterium BMS3Bbin03]|nr:CRISPR-associated nuclease/helicase Cas3 [bacterium BMS3Bbin03]